MRTEGPLPAAKGGFSIGGSKESSTVSSEGGVARATAGGVCAHAEAARTNAAKTRMAPRALWLMVVLSREGNSIRSPLESARASVHRPAQVPPPRGDGGAPARGFEDLRALRSDLEAPDAPAEPIRDRRRVPARLPDDLPDARR